MNSIFGFNIFSDSKELFIKELYKNLTSDKKIILSGNPEVLYRVKYDEKLYDFYKDTIVIPDGVGVLLAGKKYGLNFKEKIAGIEIVEDILKNSHEKNIRIYLLGSTDNIIYSLKEKYKLKYNAQIVGFHNGFFNINNCNDIVNDIINSNADILFVAMGCPRQEEFICNYFDKLNCSLYMGVGGSFDVLSGKTKRAPELMIKMRLEWLYRFVKEPWRIKKINFIFKFLIKS